MKVIFSKRQIENLRESLDINIDSDGDPSNLGAEANAALNKPGVDRVTFDSDAVNSTKPKPTLTIPIKKGGTATQAIQDNLKNDPKLTDALDAKDANVELVKPKGIQGESIVRYSKKELNEILFR